MSSVFFDQPAAAVREVLIFAGLSPAAVRRLQTIYHALTSDGKRARGVAESVLIELGQRYIYLCAPAARQAQTLIPLSGFPRIPFTSEYFRQAQLGQIPDTAVPAQAKTGLGPLTLAALFKHAAQAVQVPLIGGFKGPLVQIDQRVHKPCHGYDVLRVVFDNIFQQRRLACLDIGEVARGLG